MDTQGRVLRFDSAAKFLAPGFRVGWAVLPPPLARKLEKALFASSLGATPLAQVTVSKGSSHIPAESWPAVELRDVLQVQRVQSGRLQSRSSAPCLRSAVSW